MPNEIIPLKAGPGWPIVHLNGGVAKSTTLKNGSRGVSSHWITGYQLDGALATGDGFYLLRRSCVHFPGTSTWTAPDSGTVFDWGTEAANGHFALEMWVYIPTVTGAVASLMCRGNEASDGWKLEITSTGKAKFTAHDSVASMTITGTKSIFDRWHLITVVAQRGSATGLNLYIDGVLDAVAVDTRDLNLTLDGGTTVVCTGVSGKNMWLGPIGIYIGASANLSAEKVLSNFNEGIGRKYDGSETGLVAAWNNDEGTGTLCYSINNTDGLKVTIAGNAIWSPRKQSGSTAAVNKCGPPFEKVGEDDAEDPLPTLGLFGTGVLTTSGVMSSIQRSFPQAIRIGGNNPVRILETDGAFSLLLFGLTG